MQLFLERNMENMELIDCSFYFNEIKNCIEDDTKIEEQEEQYLINCVAEMGEIVIDFFTSDILPVTERVNYLNAISPLEIISKVIATSNISEVTTVGVQVNIERLYGAILCNAIILRAVLVKTENLANIAKDYIIYRDNADRFAILTDFTLVASNPENVIKNFTSVFDEDIHSTVASVIDISESSFGADFGEELAFIARYITKDLRIDLKILR